MKKYTKMTKSEFDNLKTLQSAGLSQHMIAKVTKRSNATVSYVCRAVTFEDYRATIATLSRISKANKEAKAFQLEEPTGASDLIEFAPEPVEELVHQLPDNDLLERIACALERLADAWEQSPKKNKFF